MSASRCLLLAGVLAASGCAGMPKSPSQTAQAPAIRFAPALGPAYILTRELHRGLSDGKAIVTRRRYRVRFARDKAGYRVDGALIASTVDAPPKLAALAKIEAERPEDGLFPIRLDRNGRIVDLQRPVGPAEMASYERGFAIAAAAAPPGSPQAQGSELLIARLRETLKSGLDSAMPAELFAPRPGEAHDAHDLASEDRRPARIVRAVHAEIGPDGTLRQLRQTVTGELAGKARESTIAWTMAPETP